MAHDSEVTAQVAGRIPGPELRLLDRRAFVGFPPLPLGPGVSIVDFALQIPDVTFPFDVSAGPGKYQRRRLAFGYLELQVDAEAIARALAAVSGRLGELEQVRLHFRAGVLEAQALLVGAERAPVTFKLAFDGDGELLSVYVYDVRLYAFTPTPAPLLPLLLTRALGQTGLLPDVEVRGGTGFTTRLLGALTQHAAVSRGYKVPHLDDARLAAAEIGPRGLRLRFASGGLPPPNAPDEELLLTLEGARAFADAEELLALGRLAEAREAYLKAGDVTEAHPFAAERLLQLLVAEPSAHELALDIAGSLSRRRERSPVAMWAEAVVRERRGETARAAERFLALCAQARRGGEEASAFFAAEAAARASRDSAPQVAVRALHEVLGLRPDHLPSLQALARAADQAGDRVGAVRAWRRIAALSRDTHEAAAAHVHLARLCAETEDDVAGARLHCEAALRLTPDQPEALLLLGELCHRSGEHLRALKALDRLRDVGLTSHELDRVARAAVLAGRVWEEGLDQPENALLRYREAIGLLPRDPTPHAAAGRVAEKLGRTQEALADYTQAIELAGPAPADAAARKSAHDSHHALARLSRTRLGDPSRARGHLEAALALEPDDALALDELIPYFRATGRVAELAAACERSGRLVEDPSRRASLFAEAGELFRTRLSQPDRAEALLTSALEAEPHHRPALEGLLALAEARRDGALLCRCLQTLASLSEDPAERLRLLRRLAVAARDLSFDLELAVEALRGVLQLEPSDLGALGELCGLQRKRGDMAGLASALEARARVSEEAGDKRLASAALRELAQVYETRLGRTGEALVAMEKAARLASDPAVLLELADLSLRADRPEHARAALEDVLSSLPRGASPERVADLRARLGRACEQLGDLDAAREHYARAFPLRRLDASLAERLEGLYARAGEERALAELRATRAQALLGAGRADEAAPLFVQSAEGLLALGESAPALMRLHAALEAVPEGPHAIQALDTLATLELQRGERHEASRLIARKAGLIADDAEAAGVLVRAATLAEGTPREEGLLEDALVRAPRFVPARLRRSQLRAETDAAGALEDLEVVLTLSSEAGSGIGEGDRMDLLKRAAALASGLGEWDVARRHLATLVARRPQDTDVLLELAQLHRRAGAREALCELLGELWPRLEGEARISARRESITLSHQLGHPERAIEALRALLLDAPGDVWAAHELLGLLGSAAAGEGDPDERLALLSILVEGDPNAVADGSLHLARARLLRDAGRLAEARADLEQAALRAADPVPLQRELAGLYRVLDDVPAELEAWRKLLELAPELADEGIARLFVLSRGLLEAQQLQGARAGFEALCAQQLDDDARNEAFLGLAEALARDPSAAAAAYLEASRQGPRSARIAALISRAALLVSSEDLAGSAEALRGVLDLEPTHAEARRELRATLSRMGDHAALAALLEEEAARAPDESAADLYRELGALYAGPLSQTAEAEAAWRKVAQLDATDAAVRLSLVDLLLARGAHGESIVLLEEAAGSLDADAAAEALRRGASLAHEAGDPDAALRLSRRAHALAPATGAELSLLAELLFLRGAVSEALPLQRELAAQSDFTQAREVAIATHLRLAGLCEQGDDVEGTEAALRAVWTHAPEVASAAERLAALLRSRQPRESLQVLWIHARALEAPESGVALLLDLAVRARDELGDAGLSAELLGEAADRASEPLPIYELRAALFRDAGRSSELLEELLRLAALAREAGEPTRALTALTEAAALAEQLGRTEEALRTLEEVREGHLGAQENALAAGAELRRARLLRDVRLELDVASAAYLRAFALQPSLEVAQEAAALAERRGVLADQAHWLGASLAHLSDAEARAQVQLTLARLHEGPLPDPGRAEAAWRAALAEVPRLPAAEAGLEALLRRQDRLADLAFHWEDAAEHTPEPQARAALLRRAAAIYRSEVGQPASAAVALWAARAAAPDDRELTRELADLLHEVDRAEDASDFDALLLAEDPFLSGVYERHRAWLDESGDLAGLAALMLGRAQRQTGTEAADSYLVAADALRGTGAIEQALLCEEGAFDRAPSHPEALARLRAREDLDVRRHAELLARAAGAQDGATALPLLSERARLLLEAGEKLLAAEALDDWLSQDAESVEALGLRAELAAEAGGPQASQPYDRRLLSVGGETLELGVRLRSGLRLGHASLAGGALEDAAGAFEAVLELAPEGRERREALSVLAEVHGRRGDDRGVFRTTLMLAQLAGGEEAEALLRRASNVLANPAEAIEALMPLARLRPTDVDVMERAAAGLRALARPEELVALYEQGAQASGGSQAARWLLQAAQVADSAMADDARALALREAASQAAPDDAEALHALFDERVRRDDADGQRELLPRLLALPAISDEDLARWSLQLARLSRAAGDVEAAKAALEALVERGPGSEGHGEALELLEAIAREASASQDLARVLFLRAALVRGPERAALLDEASALHAQGGEPERALEAAVDAAEVFPTAERLLTVAALHAGAGRPEAAAQARLAASALVEGQDRARMMLEAADGLAAVGRTDEAAETWEAVHAGAPDVLSALELAGRLAGLGAHERALQVADATLLAEGRHAERLTFADAAGDHAVALQSLWSLAAAEPTSLQYVERLASHLRDARDHAQLLALAELVDTKAPTVAAPLLDEVLLQADALEQRERALTLHLEREQGEAFLLALIPRLGEERLRPLADRVLEAIRSKPFEARDAALTAAAEALPELRHGLLHELVELRLENGQIRPAERALSRLVECETEADERAVLQTRRAQLWLSLEEPDQARTLLDLALDESPEHVPAIEALLPLLPLPDASERFVVLAEQLESLGAEDVLSFHLESLATAYTAQARWAEASRTLARLDETDENLALRAELADRQGLTGEALMLRERLPLPPDAREEILLGYLDAQLLPFAVRLGVELLSAGTLSEATQRRLAERLAPMAQGAELAAQIWPDLLAAHPADPDGWTLFADSLRLLGQDERAERMDGFGEALTDGRAPAKAVSLREVERPLDAENLRPVPTDAVPLTAQAMPRLQAVLAPALAHLAGDEVQIALDLQGGVEAWLAEGDVVVLGAGALSVFGPVELTWLLALALSLGAEGHALTIPGEDLPALPQAARRALRAVPSTLAAARVLAQLESGVRGGDPAKVEISKVLVEGPLLRALALEALTLG